MLGADGVLRGPAADGRVSVVAQVDVAAAAVAVLRSPPTYQGRTYDLTGPAAITLHEAAQIGAERDRVGGRPDRIDGPDSALVAVEA